MKRSLIFGLLGGCLVLAGCVTLTPMPMDIRGPNDPPEPVHHVHGSVEKESLSEIIINENPAKTAEYPLNYCLVSNGKLGSMGDPVVFVHEGREMKFCCGGCLDSFKKNQAKYLEKLEQAVKQKNKDTNHE